MVKAEPKSIKVRCTSWEQVRQFQKEKLAGETLSVRLPMTPAVGETVAVALGLPNGMLLAIDATVVKTGSKDDAGKYPVTLRLTGFTADMRARLERLAAGAGAAGVPTKPPAEPPAPVQAVVDASPAKTGSAEILPEERSAYEALEELLTQKLALGAHEVLGVPPDAGSKAVRAAYFELAKKYHPDVFGKYRSLKLRSLASEVFIHINRAYDRMREATPGERVLGPARRDQFGWMAELEDFQVGESASLGGAGSTRALAENELFGDLPGVDPTNVGKRSLLPAETPPSKILSDLVHAGEEALDDKRWPEAKAKLGEAQKIDPRHRGIKALYHVACGFELRAQGKGSEAMLHFETALAHDPECTFARRALGYEEDRKGRFRRLLDPQK